VSQYASPTLPAPGCSPISAVAAATQAGELFCTNAPTTCGYADPMNQTAGVPAGTTLSTTGSCSSGSVATAAATASSTINGCLITSGLNITANGVTDEGNTGTQLLHDTIDGYTGFGTDTAAWAVEGSSLTMNDVYAYNVDRIFMPQPEGSNTTGPLTSTIDNSVCWGNGEASDEHRECIYDGGNTSLNVDSSMLLNLTYETAAFFADGPQGNACGCVGNGVFDFTNDLFSGGGYTLYLGCPGGGSGCHTGDETFENDRWSRIVFPNGSQGTLGGGYYGPLDQVPTSPQLTWSGNLWDDTGVALSS
jgi:hypothetical protein